MTAELCFAGLVFAISALLLKNLGWRGAPVFALIAAVFLLSNLGRYFSELTLLYSYFEAAGEGGAAILKIIGIAYLFGISSEICRELGEAGIASALVIVGRFEILSVAIPFIQRLFSLAMSLIEG